MSAAVERALGGGAMTTLPERRILRRREVSQLVSLSLATLYRMIARGEFPRPVRLSPRLTGWRSDEIDAWLDSRERAGSWR